MIDKQLHLGKQDFDQRRNAKNMDLYIIPVIYKNITINLIITEDTDMTELEKRGFVLSEDEEEKESFGEYVARKKQDRREKRQKDKQFKNRKEYNNYNSEG